MSPVGNGRDWKDSDLSQVHRGNVSEVLPTLLSITLYLFIVSFSHIFWVDASSEESMEMSLRGISSLSQAAAQNSVDSVLQWISFLQEEWLIVFDNADVPPPEVVEKFIPPGNRGNILITSRNRDRKSVV